ncbi:MAG TPA: polyphosphate kinase [Bacteroidia bacterium]|nr:polyphosphate kinase [Bacteroidia bacterium]
MSKISLQKISTRAPKTLDKEKIKEEFVKLQLVFSELQNLLFASSSHALLVVLQGMDASGKDGAIKDVFESVNPMGCRVFSFKRPTELEMKHDFLWRIHTVVPEKGMIHVFNRSHYEDVIIQRVHKWVDEKTIRKRFHHINEFEKLLVETNTLVLKFYLHVSKEEQLERLQERLHEPSKMWKHNENDLKEREFWQDYMDAYEDAFENCAESANWNIIPADQNWYKEYLILKTIVDALQGLNLKYPGLKKEA